MKFTMEDLGILRDACVRDGKGELQVMLTIAVCERLDELIELATPKEMTREDLLRLSESLNPKIVCTKCGIFTETIVCKHCGFDMREDKPEDDDVCAECGSSLNETERQKNLFMPGPFGPICDPCALKILKKAEEKSAATGEFHTTAEEYSPPDGHDPRLEAEEKLGQEMRDAGRR